MNTTQPDADRPRPSLLYWTLWDLASLAIVMLAPSFLKLREHLWELSPDAAVQSLILGLGFLAFTLLVRLVGRLTMPRGLILAVVGIGICFVIPGFLLSRSALPASKSILLIGAGLAIVLTLLGEFLAASRHRWPVLGVLIAAVISLALVNRREPEPRDSVAHTE